MSNTQLEMAVIAQNLLLKFKKFKISSALL